MVVERNPIWGFAARKQVYRWYDHARLSHDRVFGQWFALDRSNGRCIWERNFWRPNSITGFTNRVIVATECRSDGPSTAEYGCYGIDASTGALIWTSHRNGWWGKLLRILDFIPGNANEFRDDAEGIYDNEVICSSGRVLDADTGRTLRKQDTLDPRFYPEVDDAQRLYGLIDMGGAGRQAVPIDNALAVDVSDEISLTRFDPLSLKELESFGEVEWGGVDLKLHGLDQTRSIRWRFDLKDTGYHFGTSFYDYRYCRPYVYFVVAEKPLAVPVKPNRSMYMRDQASRRHLLTLDARSGELVQDILLGDDEPTTCRIEDVDPQGLLISMDNKTLVYYPREQIGD